ncbi:MAG: M24 family metallopeptidase [Patescibacteria group bacterium]|jgi:Xaa-Pro aminopeptidase
MGYKRHQIKSHEKACIFLEKIVKEAFQYIEKNKNCTEYEVQRFILERFNHYNLKTDKSRTPIVAFGKSTSNVHYYPAKRSSRRLQPNSLIMIDIWARLEKKGSIFSDITWMAYYGKKAPEEIMKVYNLVIGARDMAIKHIAASLRKGKLPTGRQADLAARDTIKQAGHGKRFIHTTGHSLGLNHPHGSYKGLRTDNHRPLKPDIPYTIEPGVYLKNRFGVRSEINFYISSGLKLKITTKMQKKMVLLA